MQYSGLDALAAAVYAAVRDAAGGALGRSTFVRGQHLSGLPCAPACASVRTFMARLGRRARRKLLAEVVRCVACIGLIFCTWCQTHFRISSYICLNDFSTKCQGW